MREQIKLAIIGCCALAALCILFWPNTSKAAGDLSRVSGSNRLQTAIAASQRLFPMANSAGAVLLSRSDSYPDALAAASLGGLLNAPILLTPPNQALDSSVRAEIDRVLASGQTVIILGGSAAISSSVEASLQPTYVTERLSGRNRYHTARLIKERGDVARGSTLTSIIVVSGENFPDALAVSSYSAFSSTPIALIKQNSIPSDAAGMFTASIDAAFFIGGTAVLSDGVRTQVETMICNLATRISGVDRYDTSTKVANFFFANPQAISVALGTNFPDAISGGPLAGLTPLTTFGTPMILTQSNNVPSVVRTYLQSKAGTIDDTTSGYIFGGTTAITSATEISLEQAI